MAGALETIKLEYGSPAKEISTEDIQNSSLTNPLTTTEATTGKPGKSVNVKAFQHPQTATLMSDVANRLMAYD